LLIQVEPHSRYGRYAAKYSDEIVAFGKVLELLIWRTVGLFAHWLSMATEELTQVTRGIVRQSTVGGDIRGLQILDGSTIKPLIDDRGCAWILQLALHSSNSTAFPANSTQPLTKKQPMDNSLHMKPRTSYAIAALIAFMVIHL
jgi:hypothetical protein